MLEIRNLYGTDLNKNFVETLSALREVNLSHEEMVNIFQKRIKHGIQTYVAIIDGTVVGTVTLLIEYKFIHSGGRVGHIEDVAIHKDYQKLGLGRKLMEYAEQEARKYKCYKIILDCHESNIGFYEKMGYSLREMQMRKDLENTNSGEHTDQNLDNPPQHDSSPAQT